jgi:menaquinol-cytochrome c reductase iron-sulfur subunit
MTGNIENEKITRRSFFKALSGIFVGLIAFTLGIPMIESLAGTIKKTSRKNYSKLTSLNSITENEPVNLPFVITKEDAFLNSIQPENVWAVKKSESDTVVYSPICPHLGCRYQWHADSKLFICPCHHSVFNIDGKVVSGPAPRPLDTLPTKIKENDLYVLWERFKPGISSKEII